MIFRDRNDAGKRLILPLAKYRDQPDAIVIGLPRGGVVVAYEVAQGLNLLIDIIAPRKVGSPFNPELAIGAVTATGAGFFNEDIIEQLEVPKEYIQKEAEKERKVAQQRQEMYRKGRPPLNLKGKTVLLVDDGLATGATMKAAIQLVKEQKAKQIVVVIPVAPPDTLIEIEMMVDQVICLYAPPFFQAVGQFYETFGQTSDEEVMQILRTDKE